MPKPVRPKLNPETVAAFVPTRTAAPNRPIFTDEQVLGLRRFWRQGRLHHPLKDLSEAIGVCEGTLSLAIHGKTFPHVPEALERDPVNWSRRRFTVAQVEAMRREYDPPHVTLPMLAKRYGATSTAIAGILTGILYKDVPGAIERLKPNPSDAGKDALRAENIRRRSVTSEVALFIRLIYRPGVVSAKMISERYGLHIDAVFHIVNGETYRDVPGPTFSGSKADKDRLKRKLSEEQVVEARRLFREEGTLIKSISKMFGIKLAPTADMLYGRTYKDIPGAVERSRPVREAPIPDDLVLEYRRVFRAGRVTVSEIAKRLGRPSPAISDMLRGRAYTHLPNAVTYSRKAMQNIQASYRQKERERQDRLIADGKPIRPLIPALPPRLSDHDENFKPPMAA